MVIGKQADGGIDATPRRSAGADTAGCRGRVWLAIASALIVVLTSDSTARAWMTPTPDVPPATVCAVEAPSLERLNEIILAPAASASPVATRTPGVVPEGKPAGAETIAAVTSVVRELVACYNAGELLRSYGLYTDAHLRRLFARQGGFTRAQYGGLATPQPAADPAEWTAIIEIADVRMLADGSVGATVTMRYASIPMPKAFFFTFVWTGDRWLIDGILGEISFSVP